MPLGQRRLRLLDLFSGLNGWSRKAREAGHDVLTLDYDPTFGADFPMDIREFAKDPWRYIHEKRPDWDHIDGILASPDCRGFTVMQIGNMWDQTTYTPKHDTSRMGMELLQATLTIVEILKPDYYVIENPRAMMRVAMALHHNMGATCVNYCRYGLSTAKATDLWGSFPPTFEPFPECSGDGIKNGLTVKTETGWTALPKGTKVEARKGDLWLTTPDGNHAYEAPGPVWVLDDDGKPCHEAAPRGARTGIQGIGGPRAAAERAIVPDALATQFIEAIERGGPARSPPKPTPAYLRQLARKMRAAQVQAQQIPESPLLPSQPPVPEPEEVQEPLTAAVVQPEAVPVALHDPMPFSPPRPTRQGTLFDW